MRINYRLIADALDFYASKGYSVVDVPWVVPAEILEITSPHSASYKDRKYLVASGEQSFLHMIKEKTLAEGTYCCATPCYRPFDASNKDGLHFSEFYKVELIKYTGENRPSSDDMNRMAFHALDFMSKVRNEKLLFVTTHDEERNGCKTILSSDIESRSGIELGSYGIRMAEGIGHWVYGTGAALPRLEYGLRR